MLAYVCECHRCLTSVHWLPIKQHVAYTIATVTFRVNQTGQPSYLYDATEEYRSTRVSCLASAPLLRRPHVVFSSSAFSAAELACWEFIHWTLTLDSAETFLTFWHKLKTELFIKSYDN